MPPVVPERYRLRFAFILDEDRSVTDPNALAFAFDNPFTHSGLKGLGPCERGKVRDNYQWGGRRFIITTDRVSAFDRNLGVIPYRGQVLNQLSAFWFERCADILPHHLLTVPDANLMVCRQAESLPIEVVVRAHITGVTETSLWQLYQRGECLRYGLNLPPGLSKNDPLPEVVVTPTTKAAKGGHDLPISPQEIVKQGLLSKNLWDHIAKKARQLFERGQKIARAADLILVDTKYEFGLDPERPGADGLMLIDEIHTPDSSRYWLADSDLKNPQSFDKEFLRKWMIHKGYRGEGAPPPIPREVALQTAARYLQIYERLTQKSFEPEDYPPHERLQKRINAFKNAEGGL